MILAGLGCDWYTSRNRMLWGTTKIFAQDRTMGTSHSLLVRSSGLKEWSQCYMATQNPILTHLNYLQLLKPEYHMTCDTWNFEWRSCHFSDPTPAKPVSCTVDLVPCRVPTCSADSLVEFMFPKIYVHGSCNFRSTITLCFCFHSGKFPQMLKPARTDHVFSAAKQSGKKCWLEAC